MYYFAYGSNMDAEQMRTRGAAFTERRRAVLEGWVLKFNKTATGEKAKKGEGKGNIVPAPWSVVEGALYTISEDGLKELDRREGYPKHYDRIKMRVELDHGAKEDAWVYIAQPSMVADGLKPTKQYLQHYLKGKDVLMDEYYRELEKTETLDKWILIDTHILDCIDGDLAFKRELSQRIHEGRLSIQITHVQKDEIDAMPGGKAGKRDRLLMMIEELGIGTIPTKGAILDVSKWDMATFDDDDTIEKVRDFKRDENPSRDALIFNTATLEEVDILVSNDERRVKRLESLKTGIAVMSFDEFKQFVSSIV